MVFVDGLTGVMGNVDLPAFVVQRHPDQVCQRTFVVDEQHPDRRPVGPVHPRQLTEYGATRCQIGFTNRRRRHLTIVAISQRTVTALIDISYVTNDLVLRPIGRVESPLTDLTAAPCQGDEGAPDCWLVFEPDMRPALDGLCAGADIVVITWLHLADRSVRQVHPRGDPDRPVQGVFTTRSPDRPNPLGMHVVRILEIDDLRVRVRDLEAINNTQIVDIKPVLEARGER